MWLKLIHLYALVSSQENINIVLNWSLILFSWHAGTTMRRTSWSGSMKRITQGSYPWRREETWKECLKDSAEGWSRYTHLFIFELSLVQREFFKWNVYLLIQFITVFLSFLPTRLWVYKLIFSRVTKNQETKTQINSDLRTKILVQRSDLRSEYLF